MPTLSEQIRDPEPRFRIVFFPGVHRQLEVSKDQQEEAKLAAENSKLMQKLEDVRSKARPREKIPGNREGSQRENPKSRFAIPIFPQDFIRFLIFV